MEHQGNELSPGTGVVGSSAQMAYGANLYQGNPMTITSSQLTTGSTVSAQIAGLSPSPAQMAQQHLAYQQLHQQQQLQQQLQSFWASQIENLDHITDFKNHSLPLARIKKIMKADEDVRMISAEAPVLFARACELFILELTLCAWNHTEENKRRTLQRNDIAAAIMRTDIFDFLIDVVPREDSKDEVLASMSTGPNRVGDPAEGLPYYYMPPPPAPSVDAPGMTVGQLVDPSLYGQHPQTDGQTERTIQTLEYMLRAIVMDFKIGLQDVLPLVEFSYNNSYQTSISIVPFEPYMGDDVGHRYSGMKLVKGK